MSNSVCMSFRVGILPRKECRLAILILFLMLKYEERCQEKRHRKISSELYQKVVEMVLDISKLYEIVENVRLSGSKNAQEALKNCISVLCFKDINMVELVANVPSKSIKFKSRNNLLKSVIYSHQELSKCFILRQLCCVSNHFPQLAIVIA